ncbi:PREDICTED: uncharacterized protein LOC106150106 isoform X1 [Chinchilla lanigera]|uniref:uncharacterized protein LOC106150106 isoform X1 n=1 Tax=Chinchilla lanigera TaxID=34839 RepID=UPI000696E729|nr:PREDICTED: uncharacterized protein LOC106150106 isoform X1 [Chinchilla lanigera]
MRAAQKQCSIRWLSFHELLDLGIRGSCCGIAQPPQPLTPAACQTRQDRICWRWITERRRGTRLRPVSGGAGGGQGPGAKARALQNTLGPTVQVLLSQQPTCPLPCPRCNRGSAQLSARKWAFVPGPSLALLPRAYKQPHYSRTVALDSPTEMGGSPGGSTQYFQCRRQAPGRSGSVTFSSRGHSTWHPRPKGGEIYIGSCGLPVVGWL